jgi:O-antigen ligase
MNRKDIFGNNYLKNFIPFILIMSFMMLFSYDFFPVFQRTLSYVITLIFLPILTLKAIERDNGFLLNLFVLINFYLVLGVLMKYLNPELAFRVDRFRGMFGNPNGLGIFIVVAFGFYFSLKETGYLLLNRWAKILFFIVLFASLFWCSSRAALMAVIICYVFSFVYSFSAYLGWIAFAVVMIFYDQILNFIPLVTKFLGLARDLRADNVDEIKEGSGRIIAWQLAWWEIKKNMLLGEGLGFTNVLFVKYKDWLSIRGHQGHAHNAYLTFWLDTGLFGMLSYFIGLIVTVVKVSGRFKFITPILFSVLFSNYYESWLVASLNPFTPLFIITITVFYSAYNKIIKEEKMEGAVDKSSKTLIQV